MQIAYATVTKMRLADVGSICKHYQTTSQQVLLKKQYVYIICDGENSDESFTMTRELITDGINQDL